MSEFQIIDLQNVSFGYDGASPVLSSLDFCVAPGETVALLGPSGCGKSTLLRVIAGLEVAQGGRLLNNSAKNKNIKTGTRLLFQDYDAFPWFTVRDNILKGSGPEPHPTVDAVQSIISAVGLGGSESSFPNELSGGMRKRLALARTLVREPSLLLLDEPFSSLDVETRSGIYKLVQALWEKTKCGVVLVTHDVHEAILLATRVDIAGHRPMKIRESFKVSFSQPRDESIVDTPEYQNLRKQITASLSTAFDSR